MRGRGGSWRITSRGFFICGHSHILKVTRDAQGVVHLNPGAAGHHGWHKMRTILRFTVAEGRVTHLEAIELGPRESQSHISIGSAEYDILSSSHFIDGGNASDGRIQWLSQRTLPVSSSSARTNLSEVPVKTSRRP